MDPLNIALLTVGLLVLALGLLAEPLRRSLLSTPLVALVVGVLLGPTVTGLLDISEWGHDKTVLEQAARLTVAISLVGTPCDCRDATRCRTGGHSPFCSDR